MALTLDPILLEILYHKLKATTEEMGIALGRTARSTYVKEANDFGTALCDARGKFFAYPATTGVSGSVDMDCRQLIEAMPDLEPGDILVTNHPFLAGGLGSHLPDVNLLKPYFHAGRIVCYGWTFVHSSDIGGAVPSSIAPSLTNLFQEGLQIPPMKLMRRGVLSENFMALFLANTRVPAINQGDLQAQLAALSVGERRVAEIIDQHGIDVFMQAQTDVVEYARIKALEVQRRIPDGDYEFWDYMDDDFTSKIPVRLRCAMRVRDGHIHLDFTGTDAQVDAAYNVPTGGVRHPWLTTKIMHLLYTYDSELPLNYGLFENISVTVPKGSIMNPEFPSPVGIRHATAIRLNDAILGCLAKACPGLAPAPSGGTVIPAVVAQTDPESGRRVVSVLQSLVGGAGAGLGFDGADCRDRSLSNIQNTPTERGELDVRVRVERYAMRVDSGGPGKHRGGTGVIYAMRVLQDGTELLGRGLERFVFPPWGIAGGRPGAPARVILNLGTPDERELGKIDLVRAQEGDLLTIMTAGGGGYGDPLQRPLERVAEDLRLGYVSPDGARRDYGVVVEADGRGVDAAASAQLRAERGRASRSQDFDFGAARARFESVFDDALASQLATALLAVPGSLRTVQRRRIMERAVPGLARDGLTAVPERPEEIAAARERLAAAIMELNRKWAMRAP
jgi:N-methylhydantoinase B